MRCTIKNKNVHIFSLTPGPDTLLYFRAVQEIPVEQNMSADIASADGLTQTPVLLKENTDSLIYRLVSVGLLVVFIVTYEGLEMSSCVQLLMCFTRLPSLPASVGVCIKRD